MLFKTSETGYDKMAGVFPNAWGKEQFEFVEVLKWIGFRYDLPTKPEYAQVLINFRIGSIENQLYAPLEAVGLMQGGKQIVEDVNAAKLKVKQSKLLEGSPSDLEKSNAEEGLRVLGFKMDFNSVKHP